MSMHLNLVSTTCSAQSRLLFFVLFLIFSISLPADEILIRGATVYDGTPRPGQVLDVLISGNRILKVGASIKPTAGVVRIIDASGMVLAPGFIDLHNHSDSSIVAERTRLNRNFITQGVTTIVTGNCGGGETDIKTLYQLIDKNGAGTNVIHLIPHGSIREIVMKNAERAPTPDELSQMKKLIDREMQSGAWGMSTGLIYIPGKFSKTEELIELSRQVTKHGGIYASHIRSEGSGLVDSIQEAVKIAREASIPVHISHLKASGRANWGKIVQACTEIEKARKTGLKVTADQYPYVASSTRLSAMVVPDWARVLSTKELLEKLNEPGQRERLSQDIKKQMGSRDGGNSIMISRFAPRPDYVGKRLDEIAAAENKHVAEVVVDIQLAGDAGAISFGMSEEDVRFGMQKPYVATASDGGAHQTGNGDKPHPRSYGTFPRKIRYALDDKVISLEQAIHAATLLPAEIIGLKDRGRIAPGLVADIVVFDPAIFRDNSTFENTTSYATGVKHLLVNGIFAIDEGRVTGKLAGKALRHPGSQAATTIIEADVIWTGDPEKPMAKAMALRGEEIIAIGELSELEKLINTSTKRMKYPAGAMITPGLIDSHAHLSMLGSSLDELDLREYRSETAVAEAVKNWAGKRPGDSWIIGRNWDQSLWPGQVFPGRESLDKVMPNRPVWLVRVDGHAGWANGEALRRANVSRDSHVPSDGQMIKNRIGEPSGLFVDGGMGLVSRVIPPTDDETMRRRLLFAQAECLKSGLTGVHDAGLDSQERRVLEQMDRSGELILRVYGMASAPADPGEFFRKTIPGGVLAGRGRYELRAMKFFIDGAMGSRGALLFDDYSDQKGHRGLQLISQEMLEKSAESALATGWQVCTHAIGDRGNALVLDAYEKAFAEVPKSNWKNAEPRFRIEHAQVVRRQDVQRFAASQIIASMQPSHASSDQRWADLRLGDERARGAYAWRWFVQDGVKLALGSDFPVEVPSPLWGFYGGTTRMDANGTPKAGWRAEHKLSMEELLRGFTSGSAFAQFAEDRLGRLKPGFDADFVVFDRNLLKTPGNEILKTKVIATWVGGMDHSRDF